MLFNRYDTKGIFIVFKLFTVVLQQPQQVFKPCIIWS